MQALFTFVSEPMGEGSGPSTHHGNPPTTRHGTDGRTHRPGFDRPGRVALLAALFSLGAFVAAATPAEPQPPDGTPDVESAAVQALGPGESDDVPLVAAACPTFHWGISAEGTPAAIELRVSRLAEATDDLEARPVLARRLPGPSRLWTPYVGDCLERGGVYAWWVRTLDRDGEPGPWSETRVFQVLERPETAGAEANHRSGVAKESTRNAPGSGSRSERNPRRSGVRRDSARTASAASLAGATVAISGKRSETSGNAIGVVGETSSPDGAGVAAANADPGGGPDLLLDGAAQGIPDTVLTESGLDRPSGGAEVFDFENSGAGSLTLRLDGADLVTTLTDQDTLGGLGCASGDLPESDGGGGWGCLASSSFSPAVHAHDDRYYTETEMGTSGSANLHWGNLASVPAGFADGVDDDTTYGAGNGLLLTGTQIEANPVALYSPGVFPRANRIHPLEDSRGITCADAVSVAVGLDGSPVVSCASASGQLLVGTCGDPACASIGFRTFGGTGTVGVATSTVVTTGSGRVGSTTLVVYTDSGDVSLLNLQEGTTSVPVSNVAGRASIAFGPDGFPIITYATGSTEVGFLQCHDLNCSSSTQTDIDLSAFSSLGEPVTQTAVALGVRGLPVVGFLTSGSTNGEIGMVKCGDPACTTLIDGDVVAHSGGATDHPLSMVIDEGGRPVMAAGSKGGTAGLIIFGVGHIDLGPTNSNGKHAAVTVAGDGHLVAAYWDQTGGDLEMVHCEDLNCTTSTTFTADPGTGSTNVGSHVALSFGGDGRPLAIYLDDTGTEPAQALKCANAFCVPFLQRR